MLNYEFTHRPRVCVVNSLFLRKYKKKVFLEKQIEVSKRLVIYAFSQILQ